MSSPDAAQIKIAVNMPHALGHSLPSVMATNADSERTQRIRIKNRRKVYLDRNPDYFKSPELELAGATRLLRAHWRHPVYMN